MHCSLKTKWLLQFNYTFHYNQLLHNQTLILNHCTTFMLLRFVKPTFSQALDDIPILQGLILLFFKLIQGLLYSLL